MARLERRILALALAAIVAGGCSDDSSVAPDPDPGPDRAAPNRVSDPALAYPALGGDAVLTWTAPSDDDGETAVSRYDVRFSYSFPLNWDVAIVVEDPPPPGDPGATETYRLPEPRRGHELYAAIRSYDAAGNASPVSAVAHTRVLGYQVGGHCTDAFSGEAVRDVDVVLTSRRVYEHTTDASGAFTQADLAGGVSTITVTANTATKPYHSILHTFELAADTEVGFSLIEYEPTVLGLHESTLQLFLDLTELYGGPEVLLKKWRRWPIRCYIPELVNGSGLDYKASATQAALRWNERSGVELFTFVDAPPDTGVTFRFKPRAEMGGHLGITTHVQDPEGHPLRDTVNVLSEFADPAWLYRVMLHELGHTIRFGHAPAGYLMYAGQPLPNDVTDDEAHAAALFYALPNRTNMAIYDVDIPVIE